MKFIVLLPIIIPMFLMIPAIQQPNSGLMTALSFFPLFTPILMLMRQAAPGGVPGWQPLLGLAEVMVAAFAISWAASRIFRLTILLQGKTPKATQLMRWAVKG